jgi:Excalibur calcium-binding domain
MELKMFRTIVLAAFLAAAAIGFAPLASATGPYANCSQAKADGVCNITTDSPYYMAKLDRDRDGIACEC